MQILLLPSDRKSGNCHRMAPLRKLYVMTLTYIFKFNFYGGWYLPSNGTIVNVELRDLHINSPGPKFETALSWKRWDRKTASYDLYRTLYSSAIVRIMNVLRRDLYRQFRGPTFYCYAFVITKLHTQAADVLDRFAWTRTAPAVELLFFKLLCNKEIANVNESILQINI